MRDDEVETLKVVLFAQIVDGGRGRETVASFLNKQSAYFTVPINSELVLISLTRLPSALHPEKVVWLAPEIFISQTSATLNCFELKFRTSGTRLLGSQKQQQREETTIRKR